MNNKKSISQRLSKKENLFVGFFIGIGTMLGLFCITILVFGLKLLIKLGGYN